MHVIFLRVTVVVLIIVCLILAIDKTRLGLRMGNVSVQIAEKTKIILKNEEAHKKEIAQFKKLLKEKEQRFHLAMYSDFDDGTLTPPRYVQLPPAESKLEKRARQLAVNLRKSSPEELVEAIRNDLKTNPVKNEFYLSEETDLVTFPAAALMEETARQAGMSAVTRITWDLQTFRVGVRTTVSREGAFSVVADLTEEVNGDVIQNRQGSVTFPFRYDGTTVSQEHVFLPSGKWVPVGGCYIHAYHLSGIRDFQLDYELPEHILETKYRLRVFPLNGCHSATGVLNENVFSFRIKPDQTGNALFLVIADVPFFPISVTGLDRPAAAIPVEAEPASLPADSAE